MISSVLECSGSLSILFEAKYDILILVIVFLEVDSKFVEGPSGKAIQTIQHVNRLSRKMQRRLTRRTLMEAKALKNRSAETIHVLVYVAELVSTISLCY